MTKSLVYTEATGLVEVDRLGNDYGEGTIIYGQPTSFWLSRRWFRRSLVKDSLMQAYLDWEIVNKRDLPKRLKMEALLMGIPL